MSTVMKKGKLVPVPHYAGDTPNDLAYRLIQKERGNNKHIKLPNWADDFVEVLEEDYFEKYVSYMGNIYEIVEEEIRELYEMKENGNGELEYTVKYNDIAIVHSEVLRELIEETVGV
jgi:hypothetical protein